MLAYFFWLYKEIAPTSRLARPWTDIVAVVLLGIGTYSKPIPIAVLVAPIVLLAWLRRRWRFGLTLGVVAVAVGVSVLRVQRSGLGRIQLPGRRSEVLRAAVPVRDAGVDVGVISRARSRPTHQRHAKCSPRASCRRDLHTTSCTFWSVVTSGSCRTFFPASLPSGGGCCRAPGVIRGGSGVRRPGRVGRHHVDLSAVDVEWRRGTTGKSVFPQRVPAGDVSGPLRHFHCSRAVGLDRRGAVHGENAGQSVLGGEISVSGDRKGSGAAIARGTHDGQRSARPLGATAPRADSVPAPIPA